MNKFVVTIVAKEILKAKLERDREGYRENLGYDQYDKVKMEIDKLGLSMIEKQNALNYFMRECDKL